MWLIGSLGIIFQHSLFVCLFHAGVLKWQILRLRNAFSVETKMAVLGCAVKEISWLEKRFFTISAKFFAALADAANL